MCQSLWCLYIHSVCVFSVQDISCNEIQVLPAQIGKLLALRELNIRRNCLQVLPDGTDTRHRHVNRSMNKYNIYRSFVHINLQHIAAYTELAKNFLYIYFFFFITELSDLPLIRLDFSCNKITEIPISYRKLKQLQHIALDNNPMQSPPAQVSRYSSFQGPMLAEIFCFAAI